MKKQHKSKNIENKPPKKSKIFKNSVKYIVRET